MHLRYSPTLTKLTRLATAFASGMALDENIRARMKCDAIFPCSCYADYPALLEYVRVCQPEQVILISESNGGELEEDLTALGFNVSTVFQPRQMDLFRQEDA
jgi:hypothetical protein